MSIRSTLNPGMYHGWGKKPPFFEGWYFKLVSADGSKKVAIIPGVILGKDAHAFVQVLEGVTGKTAYHTFAFQDFQADPEQFSFKIGRNQFDGRHISLDINNAEGQISGEIKLGALNPWPVTLLSPGIMGWYAWVPRMECYHGVLSFDHPLDGELILDGQKMDFSGGHGYIEKDWGQSFPAAWVWFQSNHFDGVRACITASVAVIPWMKSAFRGFIVGLWLDGTLHRFATYSGARIESLQIFDDHVDWVLKNRHHRLFLTACRVQGGLLRGPSKLDMGKRVLETLNATVQVRLESLKGEKVFEGIGLHTGLEVMGDLPRLLKG
jgi:tocopherol cyclase